MQRAFMVFIHAAAEHKHARHIQLIIRKIFRNHTRLLLHKSVAQHGAHALNLSRIIFHTRIKDALHHLDLRAEGRVHTGDIRQHALFQPRVHVVGECADNALQPCLVGNDVALMPRFHVADGNQRGLCRIDAAGDGRLQHRQQMRHRHHCILSQMRHRAMRGQSADDEIHLAGLRHHRPRAGRNLAERHVGHHMHAVNNFDMRVFQRAFLDHVSRAARRLLCGLKEQHHVVVKLLPMLAEPLGKRQQIRHMAVVATGVHLAGMARSIISPRRLLNGQCVDIRAEGNHASRSVAAKHSADTRSGKRLQIVRRKRAQMFHQIRMRFVFLIP